MRTVLPLLVTAVALALAGCAGPAAPPAVPSTAPTGSSTAEPTASATATAEVASPPAASPTAEPSLAVSAGGPLADAPSCGDGVVLAAAMVEPDSPSADGWLEAGAARPGFEPASVLEAAAVLCATTFDVELDGAQEAIEVSTSYVRGDDVGAAVQSWASTHGYAAVDAAAEHPSYVLGDEAAPAGTLQAVRLDSAMLGENDLAWHERTTGFDLEPMDWVVTRIGSLP
ncbi:MAG: hypothetical protein ACQEWM_00765 [Actinomycetota bacterium]